MSKWEMVKWSEVVEIKNGRNQKAVEDSNGIYPIYGSGGVMGYANNYICTENTVVIGRKGNINKPIYVGEKFWNVDTAFGLNAKKGRLLPKYLFYFCVKFNFEKLNTTVTIPSLTKSNLLNIEIPLPPHEIQKQIAKTLDTAAELLAMRKQQLTELDNLIKSSFYDMFGDPITNEKRWEKETFRNLSIKFSDGPFGSNLKTSHYEKTGIRVIRLNNIGINKFLNEDEVYISQKHYEEVLKKHTCFPGDVVIGTMGEPNVRACIIPKYIEVAVNKADCILCRPNINKALPEYINAIINLPSFLSLGSNLFHGQTRTRVSMGQLATLEIPLPPLNLQYQFATIVTKIEEQKALVKKAIDETQYLFDSLMSEYFE